MLTERRLARLASSAARTRWPFTGRARRARAELREAAVAGDLAAVRALAAVDRDLADAVWHAVPPMKWGPADQVHAVTAITVDPEPDVLSGDMRAGISAAAASDHPVADVARAKILAHRTDDAVVDDVCLAAERSEELAEFCRAQGIAPRGPLEHARYLLLTGQLGQYQALDPDGTMLLQVVRAVPAERRTKINRLLTEHGATDLVRLLVRGAPPQATTASPSELTWLAEQYANAGDWPALWELVTESSVADAVRIAALLGAEWQPPGEADRRLCAALRATSPDEVAKAAQEPSLVRRVPLDASHRSVSLAADGLLAAVVYPTRGSGQIAVLDLATGEVTARHTHDGAADAVIAADGAGAVLCGDRRHGLVRYTGGRSEVLHDEPVLGLAAAGGTYAACTERQLLVGTAEEPKPRILPAHQVGLRAADLANLPGLAVSDDGSRIVLASDALFVRLTPAGRILTKRPTIANLRAAHDTRLHQLVFTDANHVVSMYRSFDRVYLDSWRVTGDSLTKKATSEAAPPALSARELYGGHPASLRPQLRNEPLLVPVAGMLVAHRWVDRVELLDAHTLRDAEDGTSRLAASLPPSALVARSGEHGFVVTEATNPYRDHQLEVHDARRPAVVDMLDRPVESFRATELRAVAALDDAMADPCVRLLRIFLERRFGTDVQLGTKTGHAQGATDIALGGR